MNCCPRVSPWWTTKVLLALALVIQGAVLSATGWLDRFLLPSPMVLGQTVVLAGALVVCWHYFLLKRHNPSLAQPQHLVTSGGLFRLIRHPMYLGDFVVICGLALLYPTWFSLATIPIGCLAVFQLSLHEDRQMAVVFGEEFSLYQQRSRRLLPFLL